MHTRRTLLQTGATAAAAMAFATSFAATAFAQDGKPAASGKRPAKRKLGRSGIEITPLVLGTNVFGWTADKTRSFEILDRFVDAGLQAVDTADMYSNWVDGNKGGESETIIGEWIATRRKRDSLVLITKVGMQMEGRKGLSAASIERGVEGSLRRLRTDRIDVYFSHAPDPDTSHEETLAAYQRLVEAGKVRSIGASNFDVAQIRASLEAAAKSKLPRYEVLQPRYNLYDRSGLDGPMLELARSEELGVITYSSLASGFLSGKYRSEADLGKSRRGGGIARYLDARGKRILAAMDAVAEAHDADLAEIALAWIIARDGVTAPISSATSVEQLDSQIRALELQLTAAELAALDEASRA